MMIVMKEGATEDQVQAVVDRVESVGCSAHVSTGEVLTVIGAIGDRAHAIHEHVVVGALPWRTALLASLIERVGV